MIRHDAGVGKGLLQQDAGVVDEELSREIIRPVDDEIVILIVDNVGNIAPRRLFAVRHDCHAAVQLLQPPLR